MRECGIWMAGWAGFGEAAAAPQASAAVSSGPSAVVAGEALVEGVAPGGRRRAEIAGRGRIDGEELALGRPSSRCEGRWMFGEVEVPEDPADDGWVGEEGDDAHLPMAGRAPQRVDLIDAGQETGPSGAGA